jgi:rare lipoprotein A
LRSKFTLRTMRSVHVTTAMTMLVVPASAFALTGSTARGEAAQPFATTALPMQVSPEHVAFGDPIDVAGSGLAVIPGEKVVLEARYTRAAGWQRLRATTVSRRGRFSFHAHLRHSGLLRAVPAAAQGSRPRSTPAANVTPGATGSAALSGVVAQRVTPVKVAAAMHVVAHERDVLAGEAVHVDGTLEPARAGRTVTLQGHSGSGWQTLAHARTGRRGGFAVHYDPSSTGIGRHLRVLFGGDRANARSSGTAGTMTVYQESVASWYEDGGTTGCGFHAGLGVANKSLPCGTKVRFRHAGHTVTATVDDRGPYVGGRTWDLNQTTAAALGFDGVGTVWATS